MPDRSELRAVVEDELSSRFGVDVSALRGDAHLASDLGLDSLDLIALAAALEDHFDVVMDDDDVENVLTVDGVVAMLEILVSQG